MVEDWITEIAGTSAEQARFSLAEEWNLKAGQVPESDVDWRLYSLAVSNAAARGQWRSYATVRLAQARQLASEGKHAAARPLICEYIFIEYLRPADGMFDPAATRTIGLPQVQALLSAGGGLRGILDTYHDVKGDLARRLPFTPDPDLPIRRFLAEREQSIEFMIGRLDLASPGEAERRYLGRLIGVDVKAVLAPDHDDGQHNIAFECLSCGSPNIAVGEDDEIATCSQCQVPLCRLDQLRHFGKYAILLAITKRRAKAGRRRGGD